MMSLQQINEMSRKAEERAKARNSHPRQVGTYMAENHDRLAKHMRGLPFIGRYIPDNFELVQRQEIAESRHVGPDRLASMACDEPYLFVDSSGFGSMSEPALTFPEFIDLVKANPSYAYAIVEAGQFQVVVGVYRKKTRKH